MYAKAAVCDLVVWQLPVASGRTNCNIANLQPSFFSLCCGFRKSGIWSPSVSCTFPTRRTVHVATQELDLRALPLFLLFRQTCPKVNGFDSARLRRPVVLRKNMPIKCAFSAHYLMAVNGDKLPRTSPSLTMMAKKTDSPKGKMVNLGQNRSTNRSTWWRRTIV